MRNAFASFDDVLIERLFQPASDALTNWVGCGRGAAACCCLDLASLAWIVSRAQGLSNAVRVWNASSSFLSLAVLLLGLLALISLRTLFRRAGGQPGNPLRKVMQPHRAVLLVMLVARFVLFRAPGLANAAELVMLVFAAFALYLGACAERPPARRRWAALVSAS